MAVIRDVMPAFDLLQPSSISDALGDEIFQRAPVNADTILTSVEAGRPLQHPLVAHI